MKTSIRMVRTTDDHLNINNVDNNFNNSLGQLAHPQCLEAGVHIGDSAELAAAADVNKLESQATPAARGVDVFVRGDDGTQVHTTGPDYNVVGTCGVDLLWTCGPAVGAPAVDLWCGCGATNDRVSSCPEDRKFWGTSIDEGRGQHSWGGGRGDPSGQWVILILWGWRGGGRLMHHVNGRASGPCCRGGRLWSSHHRCLSEFSRSVRKATCSVIVRAGGDELCGLDDKVLMKIIFALP